MCWYSKSAAYVLYPSLYSHHNSAHLRDLNQNICLETKSLFIVPEPLSVWRGSVSPRWRHPTFLAFFLPLPCISVSWLYWLKCSRSESVTSGDKKAVLHPAYVLIFQSTDWDRARGYPTIEKKIFIWFDNNKKLRPADWIDLKLILTKAGGEMWQFWIDLQVFYSAALVN